MVIDYRFLAIAPIFIDMKKRTRITSLLLMFVISCAFDCHAQVTEQLEPSNKEQKTEGQSEDEGNPLSKLEQMLSNMTDEQKAFARRNWLVAPTAYLNHRDHPSSYIISPNPTPDTQPSVECSGCSSAYLLRFYGEDVHGVELYQQPTFPCKHSEGAYPKCFKILFEEQYKKYVTEYFTGTTDDLKNALSRGVPLIVLLFNGKNLHYVPVVGYDESHFFIQDSVEKYRNVANQKAYNRSVDIATFDKMWNIPIESCQRLFVMVHKMMK
jgi:uncharacterized protein YvpB